MIDDDDVDYAALLLAGSSGWWTLIAFAVLVVVLVGYCASDDECLHRSCRNGTKPKLMEHECLCVERAE